MAVITPAKPTGELPRVIAPDYFWTGGCLEIEYLEKVVHGIFSVYVLRGSNKTLLVDSGHPMLWDKIEGEIETFLDGRPLDYLFCSHGEFPHAGLFLNWMNKYPNCIAVGDLRDYKYFYPDFVHRIKLVQAGDRIDLGDREFIFVPALWRDLNNTLWAFETKYRTLFVSDGFAYLHYHGKGQCDFMASENPSFDLKMVRFISEHTLQWIKFMDVRQTYADVDRLFEMLKPKLIAGSHTGLIDCSAEMLNVMKKGMVDEPVAAPAKVA